mmetsp:Transcript_5892/g.6084  ORF Transcript_5892/g.6084 Transcript_5892/m.6084 type:complete len:96 (-) Transcript_5892:1311-1598(-)
MAKKAEGKAKHKIAFDEEKRKEFILQSKRGKYTKNQKKIYQKNLEKQERKNQKKDKFSDYKKSIEEKYEELNERMKKINRDLSDDEEEEEVKSGQ